MENLWECVTSVFVLAKSCILVRLKCFYPGGQIGGQYRLSVVVALTPSSSWQMPFFTSHQAATILICLPTHSRGLPMVVTRSKHVCAGLYSIVVTQTTSVNHTVAFQGQSHCTKNDHVLLEDREKEEEYKPVQLFFTAVFMVLTCCTSYAAWLSPKQPLLADID